MQVVDVNENTEDTENTEDGIEMGIIGKEDISRDPVSEAVIGAAIEVHRNLGPGLLESVYERCLCYELSQRGIAFQRQLALPVQYKDVTLESDLRLDLVIDDQLIVEIKSVEKIIGVHEAQLLTYLRLSGIRRGLLLNFNVVLMREGIKRMVI